ncbi:hypothetical protein GQR58_005170 [Nymphon striatum]|nr:hypothetical protein GQR58_005170 [Nymphon striatum]
MMDAFPTILEALGFNLTNRKAGLGVSLFSSAKTLTGTHGLPRFDEMIAEDNMLVPILWGHNPKSGILTGMNTLFGKHRIKPKPLLLAIIGLFLGLSSTAKACEVALALTVDVSGSVDRQEYALQMNGLAGALRDPTVSQALVNRKAAVMLVQWTGTSRQVVSLPWQRMTTFEEVEAFAGQSCLSTKAMA